MNKNSTQFTTNARHSELANQFKEAEFSLIRDLKSCGINIGSLQNINLEHSNVNFETVVKILLEHMHNANSNRLKFTIARKLGVKGQKEALWPIIRQEFIKLSSSRDAKLKERLAASLVNLFDKTRLQEMIELISDPIHGESRIILLQAIRRYRNRIPMVGQCISRLRNDNNLKKEIESWK